MTFVSAIEELVETMARLRGPGGCPWDIEQDHQSIAQCLVDECSELLETLDTLDMDHMREELGDVLLQVVFHAQLAKESGHFDFEAVAVEINEKLIRRHPHVFGDVDLNDSDAVLKQWDEIKATEKADKPVSTSRFKDLPPALPALLFAYDVFKQIKKRALPVGDAVDMGAIEAMAEELDEEAAGHILFEIAAACRLKGIDPESAVRKFARRVMAESDDLTESAGGSSEIA
ncbi:MazG family protein [Pelagicoccus sp. SDUM812002]|uniref:nucleoside triphosphate pyrophosphohydrolase n=1 Tax=Pelagicoccus sp. SDUM812002 TaxID=3041266 RepID=UPI00280E10C8|nr:MazG family protein [Pelagicoccus sp. SDUM812002]MDQ8185100.1 MazG family protein [Pelagicoccus sp. SDUM812002]